MQLTTVMHLLALLVPIVVLATFDLVSITPSNALLGALSALSAYAGVSSVVGFTKDRIAMRQTNTTTRRKSANRANRTTAPLPTIPPPEAGGAP